MPLPSRPLPRGGEGRGREGRGEEGKVYATDRQTDVRQTSDFRQTSEIL